MTIGITDNKHYTDIASAIRTKLNTTSLYKPAQMASAILDISSETLHTQTYTLSSVGNSIDMGVIHSYRYISTSNLMKIPTETLTISNTGTFNVLNYKSVTTSGLYKPAGTLNITNNGTYIVNSYASVSVNVTAQVTPSNITMVLPYSYANNQTITSANSALLGYSGFMLLSGAFANCTNLTTVSFDECRYVGKEAFRYCNKISEISFPNCVVVDDSAFTSCRIQYLELPSCSYIGQSAFQQCYSLSSVYLPACEIINVGAFSNCSNLTGVLSMSKLKEVNDYAFFSCSYLSRLSLPNCTFISNYAFYGCRRISVVYLSACSIIASSAFTYCTSLSSLYLSKVFTKLASSNVFYNTGISSTTGKIYVPPSLYDAYVTDAQWRYYSRIFSSTFW